MKTVAEYEIKLPDYSIFYLINNDDSNLNPKERWNIDLFMDIYYKKSFELDSRPRYVNVCLIEDENGNSESHFTNSPAFGLPCSCYDAKIVILA